jgi:hypothetical protein
MPEEFGEPIAACVATGHQPFTKFICIKLSDEGLTVSFLNFFMNFFY